MEVKKVCVTKGKETYLATLYGKALDAAAQNPILGDRFAADAVERIDYDFKALKLPKGGDVTLPMRARHCDQWTRAFVAANPESTTYMVMGRRPFYRHLIRHLRYEFSESAATQAP